MGSLTAVIDDPRFAIILAAVPSFASGLWVWWRYRLDRKDKLVEANATRELSRDERRARELDQQQSTFSLEQSKWFADLRQENRDLRGELADTRKDRDRGWDLARYWHGVAHDLLRLYRNLRHNALNMQQWIQSASEHYHIDSPSALEPIPERPNIPMGLEEGVKP